MHALLTVENYSRYNFEVLFWGRTQNLEHPTLLFKAQCCEVST